MNLEPLLAATVSGTGGVFSMKLAAFNGEVTVLAYDDNANEAFNARVFDGASAPVNVPPQQYWRIR